MEDRAQVGCFFDPFQFDRRKTNGVGPEGRAGGEDAHSGVAPQSGRADRWGPSLPDGLGKRPDQPEVRKALDPPKRIGVAVFWLKDDRGL